MVVPIIFNPALRAARAYRQRDDAFLCQQLELRALERLQALATPPVRIGLLNSTATFHRQVQQLFPQAVVDDLPLSTSEQLAAAADRYSLILDLGAAALVNDVPGLLVQIRNALAPDGLFLSLLYGGGSLGELRQALLAAETTLSGGAAPRLHPLLTVESGIALLQRTGFAQPVCDREILQLRYQQLSGLARDLRDAGLTNTLAQQSRRLPPRTLFREAENLWRQANGTLPASFEIITLTGWKN